MKKLLSILLFFMAFSLVGFASENTVKSAESITKIEQQKKCDANCTKPCCIKKNTKDKKDVKKCTVNCKKTCCTKKAKTCTKKKAEACTKKKATKTTKCTKKTKSSCCGK